MAAAAFFASHICATLWICAHPSGPRNIFGRARVGRPFPTARHFSRRKFPLLVARCNGTLQRSRGASRLGRRARSAIFRRIYPQRCGYMRANRVVAIALTMAQKFRDARKSTALRTLYANQAGLLGRAKNTSPRATPCREGSPLNTLLPRSLISGFSFARVLSVARH